VPAHVVYDGLCTFCVRSLRVVRALDVRRVLEFHDANARIAVSEQFPELAAFDLDVAMYVVDSRRRVYAGFYAFRRLAWTTPLTWWLLPLLYFPGVGPFGARVYELIARNRSRLGCRVDTSAGPDA
jgi:predicted DCC family thiol-disulfide oxidoreductase YuxK